MSIENTEFLSQLYGKKLIVYGTGNLGRAIIDYLARDRDIELCGVTNSRMTARNGGTFGEAGVPFRSIQAWRELLPDAAILIAANQGYDKIYYTCKDEGFQDIYFVPQELVNASVIAAENIAETQLLGNLTSFCLANEIRDVHTATFSEFKARHIGEDIAVLGCGPSLNFYSQIPGIPHIGTNACALNEKLSLDYHFQVDYVPDWVKRLKDYPCVKFFRVNRREHSPSTFPEHAIEEAGARRFFQDTLTNTIHVNIEYYPLMGFSSVIFPAIHFALYTRAKRIFLVGCDCAKNGHFDGQPQGEFEEVVAYSMMYEGYKRVKMFAAKHYPDVEIVSVNPVRLKGMFHDVYTESYLDAHPEIDRTECEILRPEN